MVIKPKAVHTIESDFYEKYRSSTLDSHILHYASPGRVLNLRPSQMPFCGISYFIEHANYGMYRLMDFSGSYYTSVGTAVHEVLQNFLCRTGRFLANYKCRECGTFHKLSYVHECCGFPTQYNEIEINYKGIVGHIDAIYLDDQNKLWIVDFKTTSIKQAPKKAKDPGLNYREQIETYAVLFELQYKMKIEGFADYFIIRDNPKMNKPVMWKSLLTDNIRSKVKQRLSMYKKAHRAASTATTKSEVLEILEFGRCKDPYCRYCKQQDDERLKSMLLAAYKRGRENKRLPIKSMAEKALNASRRIH